ncbi:MAG: hypothetical protein OXR66_07595 [Candidatus Woesearchaeota archaeon]|nr:hypothetical protein [Candidatus Woesearchaeota archaeon]
MTLLTFSGEEGSTADIYLSIKPGNGAIYIDSFPLSQLDTQGSTRFANQIACNFLQENCARWDFFYTIRSGSSIVGGPSAGAAIAVLTTAVLDNLDIDDTVAMTGTINSGGLIGPVGGISHKVASAKKNGITKVLIPLLNQRYDNETNITLNRGIVEEISDGILVVKIGTLEEALLEITGKDYRRTYEAISEPSAYKARMRVITDALCDRNGELREAVSEQGLSYNDSNNYTTRIQQATHEYSRASLCFSSNAELSSMLATALTEDERAERKTLLADELAQAKYDLATHDITTTNDLQIMAIVLERIHEAEQLLEDPTPAQLGFAEERLQSITQWTAFFGMPGPRIVVDEAHLEEVCLAMRLEAEERVNYVGFYSETLVLTAQDVLEQSYNEEPLLCILLAAKAKAQANILASTLFVDNAVVDTLIQEKIAANTVIVQQQIARGIFPVLGHSYTRYAADLAAAAPYSALTFAEYALEFSHTDLYFPEKKRFTFPPMSREFAIVFLLGSMFGAAVALLVTYRRS